MTVRKSTEADIDAIMAVYEEAFGQPNEAQLTKQLLTGANADTCLSLVAIENGTPVGHIIFIEGAIQDADPNAKISILAQTAVSPKVQGQGIGGELIRSGLQQLSDQNIDVVFVFGHPFYYPRYGFEPAEKYNLSAPLPVDEGHRFTWMVRPTRLGALRNLQGRVGCAHDVDISEYWGKYGGAKAPQRAAG